MLKETAITNAKLLEMHENGWTVIDRNGRAYPIQGWVHWRVGSLGFNESISGQARQLPEGGETGRLTVTVTSTGFAQIDYVPIAQLIGGPEASS
jgi:hypothetical protein